MIRSKYKRSLVKSFKKTMSFRQTELLSSRDKKRVKNKSEINLNIHKDPYERFRDAFDVGKDCKVASASWLNPFKEHTDQLFSCDFCWIAVGA